VLAELLELQTTNEAVYRTSYLQDRLNVVESSLTLQPTITDYTDWVDDLESFMQH